MINTIRLPLAMALAIFVLANSIRAEEPAPSIPTNPPPNPWKSSASAGLTVTRGNSDTLLAAFAAKTEKSWDKNELSFGADATYGESKINGQDTTTANSVRGYGQYNRLFTPRWYGYLRADALHDDLADIAYRVTLSPGVGYYFIKDKQTEFSIEGGPGVVSQRLGDDDSTYVILRIADKFKHELNDRARIWQTAEFLPQVDKFDNYIINAEIGVEADLTQDKKLSLRAYLQDTYNSIPAPGHKKNDAKLIAAIAYKF
jgi:putative salt-induced outer membrane protein YdiY